ncbi:hypothetical protein QDY65_07580 [Pyrococcus kukulkanii]|uniref:hypothetical protein n=1 Tax=Pyrococcus kukulkanii TaxID=1609559 RepID=UPI00356770BC
MKFEDVLIWFALLLLIFGIFFPATAPSRLPEYVESKGTRPSTLIDAGAVVCLFSDFEYFVKELKKLESYHVSSQGNFVFGDVYTKNPEELKRLRGCMVYFTKPGIEEYIEFLDEIGSCKNCSLPENFAYVLRLYAFPREIPVKDLTLAYTIIWALSLALVGLSTKFNRKMIVVFAIVFLISMHFLYPYWKVRVGYEKEKELIDTLISLGGRGEVHRTCDVIYGNVILTEENYRVLLSLMNSSIVNFTVMGEPYGSITIEGVIKNEDINRLKSLGGNFNFDKPGCEKGDYTGKIKLLEEHLQEVPGCCKYYYLSYLNSLKSFQAEKEACEKLCGNYTYVWLFISPRVYYWPEMWRDTARDSFILGAVVLSLTLLIRRKL